MESWTGVKSKMLHDKNLSPQNTSGTRTPQIRVHCQDRVALKCPGYLVSQALESRDIKSLRSVDLLLRLLPEDVP